MIPFNGYNSFNNTQAVQELMAANIVTLDSDFRPVVVVQDVFNRGIQENVILDEFNVKTLYLLYLSNPEFGPIIFVKQEKSFDYPRDFTPTIDGKNLDDWQDSLKFHEDMVNYIAERVGLPRHK
jgi:hypothetical protein